MKPLRMALTLACLSAPLPLAVGAQENPHGPLPRGLDCSSCHTANGWCELKNPLQFDHEKSTGFPLTGRHAAVTCTQCHLGPRYDEVQVAATDCAGCHADVHQGRMQGACTRCHNTRAFQEVAAVAVHARTGFPLTGSHLQAPCESCHQSDRGGAFAPPPTECVSCHRDAYLNARMPDHAAAGFPTDCQQCHATLTWPGGVPFDHVSVSGGFSLVGAHAMLRCQNCHIPPDGTLRFAAAGQDDCIACHQTQYAAEHGSGGFPTTCLDCHNVDTWGDATFDHSRLGFALLGAHAQLPCANCHVGPDNALRFTPSGQNDCVACHQAQYTSTHGSSGFPTTCADCHNVNDWGDASFDHSSFFPLSGNHSASCVTCHTTSGSYATFTCFQCHEHRQAAMDDKHRGESGYSYDSNACLRCHPNGRS